MTRRTIAIAVLAAVLGTLPLWASRYVVLMVMLFALYLSMAQMWNLLAGYSGLICLGQQIFSRAVLFPSAVEALGGDLAQGLTSELWWSPGHPFTSSLTGESANDLCAAYTRETGKQWTQPIGFTHAAYEILADAMKRAASLDKDEIRRAVAATDLKTIVGPVKYNRQNYSRTPLVGGQWVKGGRFPWKLNVVYNREHPEIGLTGDLIAVGG